MIKFLHFLKKFLKVIMPVFLLLFFIYVFYWAEVVHKIDKEPKTRINDCTIHAFNEESNSKAAEIYGDRLIRDAITNSASLYECSGEIYTVSDTAEITSEKATLDGAGTLLTFEGNVVLFQKPDTYFYTNELFYDIPKERIYTYSSITIDEPEQTTTGRGMESNLKLGKARILNNIKIIRKN
ncbi:MAG: LPS export ABC transporter periplasmic protein LptC [Candidatus Muiribacteriota bacterium]